MNEYPKIIPVFPGILKYVHSREEEDEVLRSDYKVSVFVILFGVTCFAIGITLFICGFLKYLTR